MTALASRLFTPARVALASELIKFGLVGVAGLAVDTASVYALRGAVGNVAAGLIAFLPAVTATWAINRAWTFRGQSGGSAARQLARYIVANTGGFCLNRGTYAALVTTVGLCAAQPVVATTAGAAAGMLVNFGLSRRMVFRG